MVRHFAPAALIALVSLAIALAPDASARTWHVETDAGGDFSIIQDAVAAAAPGDTIRIGPGQFGEYATHTHAGNDWQVYVDVAKGPLTIVGAGRDATYIGPDDPYTWNPDDRVAGFFIDPDRTTDTIAIGSLTCAATVHGLVAYGGDFRGDDCRFQQLRYGVYARASGRLTGTDFRDISSTGVYAFSESSPMVVERCDFTAVSTVVNMQIVASATLTDCTVQNCRNAGIFDHSGGTVAGCTFNLHEVTNSSNGLSFYGSQSLAIVDNEIDGGGYNIHFGSEASDVACLRNTFEGSRDEAIRVNDCTPSLKTNDILKGDGLAVRLEGFANPPDRYVNLANNYWGVASADSISAWIVDGNDADHADIHGFVFFKPYIGESSPAESMNFGDVKSLFR